ncbi:DUF1003 domain-containing protein [Brevundimonas sp.]|uniref:DUF1003 domain-containing protein n=1 Tax=Brevundimonas sp. TaxID=1871086 RepID=UPI0025E81A9B|nr:DUF1003 domain-containing protein [Brevundimonas sp.]
MTHPDLIAEAARRLFGRAVDDLDERERKVLEDAVARRPSARDLNVAFAEELSFGDRLADRVAEFGGSWRFIILFGVFLALWAGLNILLATQAFDPYPFIFLNLMLSMVAAIQAPVIMMSQNRQAAKDRLNAAHDYEVNLKAELEIMALHEKLDAMRTRQLEVLMQQQQEQIDMLTRLLQAREARS